MSENRESAIKLFGMTIPLQLTSSGDEEESQDVEREDATATSQEPESQDKNESATCSSEIHKPASADQEDASSTKNPTKTAAEGGKKPDKILPCPRCRSLDTKFCYYNNYNINQPRHFCRNCQRYWTAGGTMRNVPVGAGRRKSKHSSLCRLQALRPDAHEPVVHYTSPRPNGTVLSFGTDAPVAEKANGCNKNSGDEPQQENEGSTAPVPCFSGSPWPYLWAPAPPLCASTFPVAFYPAAAYWSWSIPWPSSVPPSSPNHCYRGAGSSSVASGKHSRDASIIESSIHKTPRRIDDPEEATKSSVRTAVGVKSSKIDAVSNGGLLKAFQPKLYVKNQVLETPLLVHANPAALSRSLHFRETS
ncbi:unnamed protein product [Musa textilis]